MTLNKLLDLLKIPAAALAAVGAIWITLDFLEVRPVLSRELNEVKTIAEANQQGIQFIQWQILDERAKQDALSPEERLKYCWLSEQLRLKGLGCR